MKASNPDLAARLRDESERINREFQGVAPPEIVERCISSAKVRIAAMRVPDYAPIFFARYARRLLREAIAGPARRSVSPAGV